MINERTTRLPEILAERVEEKYRRLGYDVQRNPSSEILPKGFYGYRPDLIATKRKETNLAFEVWEDSERRSIYSLTDRARLVAETPNWRLILVTGNAIANTLGVQLLDDIEIQSRYESLGLEKPNIEDGSRFLLFWVLLEATLRKRAILNSIPVESLESGSLINHLYSLGEVSLEQFDVLKPLLETRNLLVHGYQSEHTSRDLVALREVVDELLLEERSESLFA